MIYNFRNFLFYSIFKIKIICYLHITLYLHHFKIVIQKLYSHGIIKLNVKTQLIFIF